MKWLHTIVAALFTVWVMLAPLVWILRDGLGPGAKNSDGGAAIMQFLGTFYWGPIALVLVFILILTRPKLRGKR